MFTKEIYWQLQLVMFLDQKDDWCSGTELAKMSGLSINTVQKYLDRLQELANEFSDVTLEKHHKYGIRLSRKPDFPLQRLLREIIRQSSGVSFIEELLLHGKIDARTFCEKNYISLSTFRRRSAILEEQLKPLGLELATDSPLRMIGPEHQIRYLFFQYLWTIYRGIKELPWEIEERMAYPIEQLSDLFTVKFTNVQRSQLGVLLFVFEHRIKSDPTNSEMWEPMLKTPSLFSHWSLSDWGMFLFFLKLFPIFWNLEDSNSFVKIPPQIQQRVATQSRQWQQLFEHDFTVVIEGKGELANKLEHLFLFNNYLIEVQSLTGLFPIVDEEYLQTIVPQYMALFSKFIQNVRNEIDDRNPRVTELFSLLLSNTIVPYLSYRPVVKFFLLSDLGQTFEAMQKELLIAGLSSDYQVTFVQSEAEADLILSNMPTHYSKSLQICSTINARDLRLIRQALKSSSN
ncbi:hypothetical protein CF160_07635 [Enterococcus pseudoavium]|nr:hypothetical protein CF160_07635 [Enterococcus pseudoavium]